MEIKEVVDLLVSNGIGVTCIIYFMVRDWRFLDTLNKTLTQLCDATNLIMKVIERRD